MNFQEDVIQTDVSLMPFTEIQTEKAIRVPQDFMRAYYVPSPGAPNAEVIFKKAATKQTIKRSFNKVDAYFSYVGGLVGTIIGLIFIMGPFTEKAYELSLARKVMVTNEKEDIESQSFNVGYFLLMYVKSFLEFFNVNPDWPKVQQFAESSD